MLSLNDREDGHCLCDTAPFEGAWLLIRGKKSFRTLKYIKKLMVRCHPLAELLKPWLARGARSVSTRGRSSHASETQDSIIIFYEIYIRSLFLQEYICCVDNIWRENCSANFRIQPLVSCKQCRAKHRTYILVLLFFPNLSLKNWTKYLKNVSKRSITPNTCRKAHGYVIQRHA